MKLKLIDTTSDNYIEYYKVRCSPADIYWNGYLDKPNMESFRGIYLNRMSSSPFDKPEDRRNYLIQITDEENNNSEIVGFVQLIKREDGIDIGYTVVENYQGYGYATQALLLGIELAKKNDQRIYVQIRDDNFASQGVAKKCGFVRTDEYTMHDYPKAGRIALRKYRLPIEIKSQIPGSHNYAPAPPHLYHEPDPCER